MRSPRNHCAKKFYVIFLSFSVILFSYSSVLAQWISVTPPAVSDGQYLGGVHFTSADEGWAVGSRKVGEWWHLIGVLLHYQGGTWTSVAPPDVCSDWNLSGVHFTSADEGWAFGFDNVNYRAVLLHYQNGTWTSVTLPVVSTAWWLSGVHFTSANEGWAVGFDSTNEKGVLLHYQKGTWTSVTPPSVSVSWSLSRVHFTSADEGWAVGENNAINAGLLLRYQNGIWTSVTPPDVGSDWGLNGVHFTSANEGWAVGFDYVSRYCAGVLLHYQNGIWTSVAPPTVSTYWMFSGVHFTSADEGWAALGDSENGSGALLHYQSGTWTLVRLPAVDGPSWGLAGVHFTSANEGWAVGWDWGADLPNQKGVLFRHVPLVLPPKEGTLGMKITYSNAPSGFGNKKGKVLIGGLTQKIDTWSDTSITFIITKSPVPGETAYDVSIRPKDPKGTPTIDLPGGFGVRKPYINPLTNPDHGSLGAGITLKGMWFGTKKGKVYLIDNTYRQQTKTCKITNWYMDSTNGESTLTFVVPKLPKKFYPPYVLKVTNKVGTALLTPFTVDPPPP